jgi:hypothetical protein
LPSLILTNILKFLVCRLGSKRVPMIENQEDLKSGVALSDGPVRNPDIVSIEKERENARP